MRQQCINAGKSGDSDAVVEKLGVCVFDWLKSICFICHLENKHLHIQEIGYVMHIYERLSNTCRLGSFNTKLYKREVKVRLQLIPGPLSVTVLT